MTGEVIFTNANVVTPQGTIYGTVVTRGETIAAVEEGLSLIHI